MKGLVEYFLDRNLFVNLLSVILIIAGGIVAFSMNREAFPNVDFDIVSVSTVYPGASSAEIEKLVTKPIEDRIKEVDGIEEYTSSSIENLSSVIITLDPDLDDTQKVIDDIRSAVDRVDDLPADAERPLVQEITSARQPVIEVALARVADASGEYQVSERELRDQAYILEQELMRLDGTARIARRGWRDLEMHVLLDPAKTTAFYVGTDQIVQTLSNRNINFPGGEIKNDGMGTIVRTVAEFDRPEEIAEVYIRSNELGQGIRIADVAVVREEFADAQFIEKTAGNPSISLTVLKRESADIIDLVADVMATSDRFAETLPEGIEVTYANDLSFFVQRRLGVLFSNGFTGLALVVVSLFFFMGWRTSLMVAIGIPIAFGMAFLAMSYFGQTLNLLTMFGLIIVVGILVDDAIIVSENFYRYYEQGYSAYEAAKIGTAEMIPPVLATFTTTVAAFGPMLFMSGIFGKFVFSIPLVVILAMAASVLESFFILPCHLYDINKTSHSKGMKGESGLFQRFRREIYEPALARSLRYKWIPLSIMGGLGVLAIVLYGLFGSFRLFPGAVDIFQVKLTAENGTTIERMEEYTRPVERTVARLSGGELDVYTTRVGIQQTDPNDPFTRRGGHVSQVMVYMTPEVDRRRNNLRTSDQIIEEIRSQTEWLFAGTTNPNIPDYIPESERQFAGKLEGLDFEKIQGGPPVGRPVAIEITGDDFDTLQEIAERYKEILSQIDGIVDIDDNFEEGKDEIRIRIDERYAAMAGITVQQVALALNTALDGTIATRIKRPDEEVDVRVRFQEQYRQSLDVLDRIMVRNQTGNLIPLRPMLRTETGKGITAIRHYEGQRLITVSANLESEKLDARTAANRIQEKAGDLIDEYPGYRVRYAGENEDTDESFASLGKAFLGGLAIIYLVLASLFRSLVQPFIVLAAVPFALIGVVIAFVLHQEPFSFLGMMGVIGLSGVVVNNCIVLVDFANNIRRANPELPVFDAIHQAASTRLRPVLLTTITTVLGLLPTAYGLGGFDPFLVPMALSFAWGLLFASLLTLGLVPVFYLATYEFKDWLKAKLPGRS